jgi:hypothetical protein
MGKKNEHQAFLITEIKKTHTTITPSIEMGGQTIRNVTTRNILGTNRISIVANSPNSFPVDPEENEVTLKDNIMWIYSRVNNILEWRPLGGGGGTVVDNIPAGNIIEDSEHRFVSNSQLTAIQEVVQGLIPAPKIVQDPDHQFVNQDQIDVVNNLMDGVEVDGGDIA